ncbi:iron complex outermembrane receptor protein [Pseudoduganella flava]|uniref:Iron complex outermembrane receptor protein n=1 Tax=Pseudoduganella flava TaxID=871742 RepID=A0A562PWY7_9BURK|nr:TonB-dependent receptor [Pseudoduganella flava]QGZ39995.1 TonB-dependent receptor [Pseudoduganella flava]TWI48937.1 iron complex outermembrane receptor protein [Pseudoduganella flava]
MRHFPPRQGLPRLTPLAAALLGCCPLLFASAAHAQQADTPAADSAIQSVVVTGMRRSIENSIAIKRDADSIVEAVTAEDIGKLPDMSIAESIARLAGLTAQRVEGRAQVISIRGLAPDFSGTLLNGREQVSTSNNRGAEYDQYPSELINGVTVYKTPDVSLMGQGLSGTVDLQTVRPLDMPGRTIALNARAEKNSNGKLNTGVSDRGGRFSVSYVDQFMDRKLGVAVGFAHLDAPGQQKEYKSWWWGADNNLGPGNADVVALKGAEVTATSREMVRDGLMAVLEYRPDKNYRTALDLYYSEFDQKTTMRGAMWNSHQWSNIAYRDPVIDTIGGTRLLTGGVLVNLEPIIRNDYNTRKDKLAAFGWNNKYKLDRWSFEGDLSYSSAKRREQVLETYAGLGPAKSGLTDNNFRFRIPVGAGLPVFTPSVDFTDAGLMRLADVADWGKDADMHRPVVEDKLGALKLGAKRELDGLWRSVEGGLYLSKREKEHADTNNYWFLKNGRAPAQVSSDLLRPSTSLAFSGIPAVMAYDVMGVLAKYYDQQPARPDDQALQDWGVTEKTATGYAKLSIDTELGPVPLRGNVGMQVVHVNQESRGVAVVGGQLKDINGGASYTDYLPSTNLIFDLGRWSDAWTLRFGAAKTLARPQMSDMRAGVSGGVSGTTFEWSGSGGNPRLEPWRANSYDLSMEKYFGKRSYIAGAYFYKKLKTYIYNQQTAHDFTGFPNPSTVEPISNIGTLNRPANGNGGMVRGVELSGSLEGGMLWDPLDGFGLIASVSGTESSIHPNGPGTKEKLPGLSGVVRNITLYYEKYGFSTRVSQRYRSAYRGEVTGLFAQRSFSEILAEKQIDFQVGYAIESGPYKGLSILLQVNNLNNEPYQTRQGDPFASGAYAPERYTTYGRQMLLGLNYKL